MSAPITQTPHEAFTEKVVRRVVVQLEAVETQIRGMTITKDQALQLRALLHRLGMRVLEAEEP